MRCWKFIEVTMQFGRGTLPGDPSVPDSRPYEDRPDWVGWLQQPLPVLRDNKWVDHPTDTRVLFGWCDNYGYLHHQYYGSDHVDHMNLARYGEVPTWVGFLAGAIINRWHYFDAGSNGYPVRITAQELHRALFELGLVEVAP